MILRSVASTAIASTIAVSSIGIIGNVAQAGSAYTFKCLQNSNNNWTTFAVKSNNDKREFIKWRSDDFTLAGYTPKERCFQVSGRMNVLINSGANFLTSGTMNKQPVICTTSTKGGNCEKLLYTLKPHQNAEGTLRDLLALNARNFSGDPLLESNCRTYVSINGLLKGQEKVAQKVCF